LSHHPTRDPRPRKFYLPPFFTRLRSGGDTPPGLPEKVRAALKELEAMLRADPKDSVAADLQQALRHMLDELESKQRTATD
jgi:hypothetical protein